MYKIPCCGTFLICTPFLWRWYRSREAVAWLAAGNDPLLMHGSDLHAKAGVFHLEQLSDSSDGVQELWAGIVIRGRNVRKTRSF